MIRAGAHGLSLLSDPLDARVMQLLKDGPLTLTELRQSAGLTPQTTLRKHLKALTGHGLLIRTQAKEFPSPVTYELADSGRGLRTAAELVENWLGTSPSNLSPKDDVSSKRTIKSLVDAWTTTMLRALVAKPLSLTELDRVLLGIDYPAIDRRLTALRLAGLIEVVGGNTGSRPYRVTRWLREAVGPLIVTADWERKYDRGVSAPLDRLDIETVFLMGIPLVRLPTENSGTCALIVDFHELAEDSRAGVAVNIERGRPVSLEPLRRGSKNSVAQGSGSEWLSALSGGESSISFEGDHALAYLLVVGLRNLCTPQTRGTADSPVPARA